LKNKLTQFFTPYPTAINSPFNMNHFNFISTYFKNNSSIYTSIKTNFQNPTNLTIISPQLLTLHPNAHTLTTTIQHI
ncbi:TcaA NTF2-like domain-containing protein, partial [Staphylococcus epidermidis]